MKLGIEGALAEALQMLEHQLSSDPGVLFAEVRGTYATTLAGPGAEDAYPIRGQFNWEVELKVKPDGVEGDALVARLARHISEYAERMGLPSRCNVWDARGPEAVVHTVLGEGAE